jgi:hypothetical protein
MKKKLNVIAQILFASAFLSVALPCLAQAHPPSTNVGYSEYKATDLPSPEEKPEATVDEIQNYLQQKVWHVQSRLNGNFSRNFLKAGKIIIKVHKVRPEYLEVFTQNSSNPEDLTPLKIFKDNFWKSNRALVSTGGSYGGRAYPTPNGVFNLDSLELMHYSTRFENAPMPWSMFFNGGIAIHGATPEEYIYLGRPVSHGCVRLHPENAKALYENILARGQSSVIVEISAD